MECPVPRFPGEEFSCENSRTRHSLIEIVVKVNGHIWCSKGVYGSWNEKKGVLLYISGVEGKANPKNVNVPSPSFCLRC